MSRNWDDDDWDRPRRPRRSWEDDLYEEMPIYRAEPSGAVTSVAVASFIWGGLFLLISGCFGFCFLMAVGARGGPPPGAVGMLGGQESLLGIRSLVAFAWAVGALVAGCGLVARRSWGRVLSLILAAFAGLGGIGSIIEGIYEYSQGPNIPGFDRGLMMFGLLFSLGIGLLLVVYSVWAFIVLVGARNSEEFH
jgi:hypothetical protein